MKGIVSIVAAAGLLGFGALYGLAGITTIQPGEFAVVVKQFGNDKGVLDEGLSVGTHWKDPVMYDIEPYDTKAKKHPLEVQASTKDGQPVKVTAVLEVSLDPDRVKYLHAKVGRDYFLQVIEPAAYAAIQDALPTQLSDTVYTDEGRVFIQEAIKRAFVEKQVNSRGMLVRTNLQEIKFLNADFVNTLEEKARAAQLEEIERRKALAAEQSAIKVENEARGKKMARIQSAEANKEEKRLEGEGLRLQKEEEAKGILALAQAEAEGIQLKQAALAGPGGELLRDIEVLGGLGANIEFYGVPTGAPGTSTYIIDEALKGKVAVGGN